MPPRRQQCSLSDSVRATPATSAPRRQQWHLEGRAMSSLAAASQQQQWRLVGNGVTPLTTLARRQHQWRLVQSTGASTPDLAPLQQQGRLVGNARPTSTVSVPSQQQSTSFVPPWQNRSLASRDSTVPAASPQQRRGPRIMHCAPAERSARQRAAAASVPGGSVSATTEAEHLDGSSEAEPTEPRLFHIEPSILATLGPLQQRRGPRIRYYDPEEPAVRQRAAAVSVTGSEGTISSDLAPLQRRRGPRIRYCAPARPLARQRAATTSVPVDNISASTPASAPREQHQQRRVSIVEAPTARAPRGQNQQRRVSVVEAPTARAPRGQHQQLRISVGEAPTVRAPRRQHESDSAVPETLAPPQQRRRINYFARAERSTHRNTAARLAQLVNWRQRLFGKHPG